jgi:membrane protease YdiL (CAAX protease family)
MLFETVLKSVFDISIVKNLVDNKEKFRVTNDRWDAFLKISVLGPFEEEFLFRLILVTKSPFLRFVVLLGWIEHFAPQLLQLRFFSMWYNAISLIILLAIITSEKISKQEFSTVFKKDSYNYLCWGLTLAFALGHISNFAPVNWSFFYLYPIYVLPQFLYGIVFSFLAIRYNSILWPFLLHAAINSTAQIHRFLTDIF